MIKEEVEQILQDQKKFFDSGKTLNINYRLENLKKLRSWIFSYEKELSEALNNDFQKPYFEVLATESRFVISELNMMIRSLRKWSHRRRVRTSVANFISKGYIEYQPYGQVLILSPWNYPFQLSMIPVMSALAAGNVVILSVRSFLLLTGTRNRWLHIFLQEIKNLQRNFWPEHRVALLQ